MLDAIMHRRQQLRANGYMPLPLFGKAPPLKEWQKLTVISADMIRLWEKVWPDAANTGILTRYTPTLDLDILNEEAAIAVEDMIRERYEERGYLLVRIGKPPKRAILFRTNDPFKKITVNLIARNNSAEKIEFLADAQQVVVDGIHPETKRAYGWHGGVPWDIAHAELPYLHEQEAHQLVEDVVRILADHGYSRAPPPRSIATGRGGANKFDNIKLIGEERWHALIDNILHSRDLHASFRDLAAMLFASGMQSGPAKHLLQALGEFIEPYDARVEARLRDIERAVDTAFVKYSKR
jgi:Bifunctional DNA primase/polymerase, N-terminal